MGAIEAKNSNKKLTDNNEQVKKHIESFTYVIFTNGLEWKFYYKQKESVTVNLGSYSNNVFKWKDNDEWANLLGEIHNFLEACYKIN